MALKVIMTIKQHILHHFPKPSELLIALRDSMFYYIHVLEQKYSVDTFGTVVNNEVQLGPSTCLLQYISGFEFCHLSIGKENLNQRAYYLCWNKNELSEFEWMIDDCERGKFISLLKYYGINKKIKKLNCDLHYITKNYKTSPEPFHEKINQIIDILKENNL